MLASNLMSMSLELVGYLAATAFTRRRGARSPYTPIARRASSLAVVLEFGWAMRGPGAWDWRCGSIALVSSFPPPPS